MTVQSTEKWNTIFVIYLSVYIYIYKLHFDLSNIVIFANS